MTITTPSRTDLLHSTDDVSFAVEYRSTLARKFAVAIALIEIEERTAQIIQATGTSAHLDLTQEQIATDPVAVLLHACRILLTGNEDAERALRTIDDFTRPELLRIRRITIDPAPLAITLTGLVKTWSAGNPHGAETLLRRAINHVTATITVH